jgi:hypothetical protein
LDVAARFELNHIKGCWSKNRNGYIFTRQKRASFSTTIGLKHVDEVGWTK